MGRDKVIQKQKHKTEGHQIQSELYLYPASAVTPAPTPNPPPNITLRDAPCPGLAEKKNTPVLKHVLKHLFLFYGEKSPMCILTPFVSEPRWLVAKTIQMQKKHRNASDYYQPAAHPTLAAVPPLGCMLCRCAVAFQPSVENNFVSRPRLSIVKNKIPEAHAEMINLLASQMVVFIPTSATDFPSKRRQRLYYACGLASEQSLSMEKQKAT